MFIEFIKFKWPFLSSLFLATGLLSWLPMIYGRGHWYWCLLYHSLGMGGWLLYAKSVYQDSKNEIKNIN